MGVPVRVPELIGVKLFPASAHAQGRARRGLGRFGRLGPIPRCASLDRCLRLLQAGALADCPRLVCCAHALSDRLARSRVTASLFVGLTA